MIIYYAGVDRGPKDILDAIRAGARHFMLSFFYADSHATPLRLINQHGCHVMVDSGAFSAWRLGINPDINKYMEYLRENRISKYVNMDVVGDPEASYHNLQIMEAKGFNPIPVFHIGTDWSYLDRYAAAYPYIALGGMVGKSTEEKDAFLTEVFRRYPEHLFHGLGVGTPELIMKYRFNTVDSTTWMIGKKGWKVQTDTGQVKLPADMDVSERVAVNIRYFRGLETRINLERFGVA